MDREVPNLIPPAPTVEFPEIEKAGTSLVGLVSKFSNDPLTGLPVPANSQAGTDYFDAPYYNLDANGNQRLGPLDSTGADDLASAPFTFPIVDLVLPKGEVYGGYTPNALEVNIFVEEKLVFEENLV